MSHTKEKPGKEKIEDMTIIQKELLLNSITQKELLKTTKELSGTIKELTSTLKIIEQHEYLELHKTKWKLVVYNIMLGFLFAIGTVFGLVFLSWLTFHFFQDSVILNKIVENQLKMRQFDVKPAENALGDEVKKLQQAVKGMEQKKVSTEVKTLSGSNTGK